MVGTGGDGSGSLNLSTGAALLTAACGQPVVKHGNGSVSSRCGSADVLREIGLEVPLDERAAGRCLAATGFTFLFAPHYHPAMRALAPVRRSLGVRTVFNLLGPLTNPAAPPFLVVGAYSEPAARLIAETLAGMSIERAFVVHGAPGWDEATPVGPFVLFDVRREPGGATGAGPGRRSASRTCSPEDLIGGDAPENARRLKEALSGSRGPDRNALVLGAALALEVTGREPDLMHGLAAAERVDRYRRRGSTSRRPRRAVLRCRTGGELCLTSCPRWRSHPSFERGRHGHACPLGSFDGGSTTRPAPPAPEVCTRTVSTSSPRSSHGRHPAASSVAAMECGAPGVRAGRRGDRIRVDGTAEVRRLTRRSRATLDRARRRHAVG